jgi:hypothetical protein
LEDLFRISDVGWPASAETGREVTAIGILVIEVTREFESRIRNEEKIS